MDIVVSWASTSKDTTRTNSLTLGCVVIMSLLLGACGSNIHSLLARCEISALLCIIIILLSNLEVPLPSVVHLDHTARSATVRKYFCVVDRLCGLVARVPGYRSRGPVFDSRRYQIFWEIVGLERGPLSLVSTLEEVLGGKAAAPV
jgi:hypothetical protein